MEIFDSTTLEGLGLLEKRLISGFNIEDGESLSAISLYLKYYHNSPEHIIFLIKAINNGFKERFNKNPTVSYHEKKGCLGGKNILMMSQAMSILLLRDVKENWM